MMIRKYRNLSLHFMLLPSLVFLIVFAYIPMAGIVMAFQNFKPAFGLFGEQKWIGLGNFAYLLAMPTTMQVLWNTIYISFAKMVLNLIIPIFVSILINEVNNKALKKLVQTSVYLPNFLSWVILGGIFNEILSPSGGVLNQLLGFMGIQPIYFLGDNHWFPLTIISTDVWKNFGFGTVVFLAAITGIDPCLYESALIDGANRLKQIFHITLPGMKTIIILVSVLSLGNILNAGFDQVFNMYSPVVYQSGDIIDTFVYRLGILQAQYGVATAVGLFKSIVSILFIGTSYFLAYRFGDYRIF